MLGGDIHAPGGIAGTQGRKKRGGAGQTKGSVHAHAIGVEEQHAAVGCAHDQVAGCICTAGGLCLVLVHAPSSQERDVNEYSILGSGGHVVGRVVNLQCGVSQLQSHTCPS